jgi:carboxypeptidase C (cathepsin A)
MSTNGRSLTVQIVNLELRYRQPLTLDLAAVSSLANVLAYSPILVADRTRVPSDESQVRHKSSKLEWIIAHLYYEQLTRYMLKKGAYDEHGTRSGKSLRNPVRFE